MSDKPQGPSRLARQLAILGLGDGTLPESELAGERRALAAAAPKPLEFPPSTARPAPVRRPRAYAVAAFGALAAAGVALVIVRNATRGEPPHFQVMGAGDVHISVLLGAEVKDLPPAADLPAGARVKASVLAAAPATAYWGVVARDGRLLSDPAWIAQNRLDLKPGERASFAGSLALEGASEGETLVIVTCPAAAGDVAAAVARAMPRSPLPEALGGCREQRSQLRR